MWINEIFHSIQGEGRYAGEPSTFIRTSGCNLRCWFCDTPDTSWDPQGQRIPLAQIVEQVARYECRRVVVTGGEPLLQPEFNELIDRLNRNAHLVTVETAGTIAPQVDVHLMSVSPKLSNSTPHTGNIDRPDRELAHWTARHDEQRDQPDVIRAIISRYDHQFKFVIDTPEEVVDVERYGERYPELQPENIWLMPQARTAEEIHQKLDWLKEAAADRGWSVSPRLHIERWGNVKGK